MKSTEKNTTMLETELDLIKRSLLIQKSEILNKSHEFKKSQITAEKAADEADAVVQNLQDNLTIQQYERDRRSLVLIDKALSKFVNNTYGLCECCEDQIELPAAFHELFHRRKNILRARLQNAAVARLFRVAADEFRVPV